MSSKKNKDNHENAVDIELVPRGVMARSVRRGRSLSPDMKMVEAYVAGNPEARAAIDSWQFKHKVTTVSVEEWDRLVSR